MYPSSSDWWPWDGLSGSKGGNESGSSNSDRTLSRSSNDFSTSSGPLEEKLMKHN